MNKRVLLSVSIVAMFLVSVLAVMMVHYPGENRDRTMENILPDGNDPSETAAMPQVLDPASTVLNTDCGDEPVEEDTIGPVDDGCRDLPVDDCDDMPVDDCNDVPPECHCGGCTYTIGYWKNHAGLGHGNQADMITPLIKRAGGIIWLGTPCGDDSVAITTAAEAKNYLDRQGESSNGINRLYAQLLAAKLNILNGACDDAIEDVIDAADRFLADHDDGEWDCLGNEERMEVNGWKDMLDEYNNGLIGPGHCD